MTRNRQQVTSTYPRSPRRCGPWGQRLHHRRGGRGLRRGPDSFARLQRRLGVRDPGPALRAEVPVYLFVFDVLWADGRDVRPFPLRERKRLLRGLLSFRDPLRFTEHRDADGEAYFREACAKGWEGIIAKRAGSPYRPGRTRDWLKFKCENEQEFVIGGYTDPRGSRTGFGALLLGYYDSDGNLRYAGKVGTGFDRRPWPACTRPCPPARRPEPPFEPPRGLPRSGVHWVEPRLVAQVGFTEWTANGRLRHPRFKGLRRDKEPADVVRKRRERTGVAALTHAGKAGPEGVAEEVEAGMHSRPGAPSRSAVAARSEAGPLLGVAVRNDVPRVTLGRESRELPSSTCRRKNCRALFWEAASIGQPAENRIRSG